MVAAAAGDRPQPFVMVEPRIDREALRKLTRPAPLSDADREARSRERNPNADQQPAVPARPLGRADRSRRSAPRSRRDRGRRRSPRRRRPGRRRRRSRAERRQHRRPRRRSPRRPCRRRGRRRSRSPSSRRRPGRPAAGRRARRGAANLNRYAQDQQLNNPNGGNQVDPAIQFDSKGVEFGPWLRRFVAQVKRNWFVPYAAMSLKGHVVITFNVHKDGRITDLQVLRPSDVVGLQQRRAQRPRDVEPDDGAAAGVPGRQGVLHGHVLLQRDRRGDAAAGARPRLVAILGATAAGKSALGIALARHFGGEIVACDSTAVFRGIDIGTDKVPAAEQQGVPHHLIDVAEPTEVYSAARYAQDAAPVIRAITARGRLPILVGGTGLYFRALVARPVPGAGPARGAAGGARSRRGRARHRRALSLGAAPRPGIGDAASSRATPSAWSAPSRWPSSAACRMTAHFAETASPIADYDVIAIGVRLPAAETAARVARRVEQQFERGVVDEVRAAARGRRAARRPRRSAGSSTGRSWRCSPASATRRPPANSSCGRTGTTPAGS